jgi:hypothetical protein
MLTPIDVHFLVGLLTLISRPDGVELELGSTVFDEVAEEDRDVDVTVRAAGADGQISVFEGLEVKDHARPLDVIHVEQLCAKLRDMPAITDRGIVSASGYTEAALNKARHYGVTLYSFVEWTAPVEVATVTLIPNFEYVETGYRWVEGPHVHFTPNLNLPESLAQQLAPGTPLFDKTGTPIAPPMTYQGLADKLASGAANIAKALGHPLEMAVGEKKPVIFNIKLEDERFALVEDQMISLTEARISGVIEYVEQAGEPLCKVLVRLEDQHPIVACAVFDMSGGNLGGIAFDGNRRLRFLNIPVADRLFRKIYRRRLKQGREPPRRTSLRRCSIREIATRTDDSMRVVCSSCSVSTSPWPGSSGTQSPYIENSLLSSRTTTTKTIKKAV